MLKSIRVLLTRPVFPSTAWTPWFVINCWSHLQQMICFIWFDCLNTLIFLINCFIWFNCLHTLVFLINCWSHLLFMIKLLEQCTHTLIFALTCFVTIVLYDWIDNDDDDDDLFREVSDEPLENIHTRSQTVIVDERLSLFLKKHLAITIEVWRRARGCMHLVASWEEWVHGEVCEPVQLLEALVDPDLRCEMGVRELVHLQSSH